MHATIERIVDLMLIKMLFPLLLKCEPLRNNELRALEGSSLRLTSNSGGGGPHNLIESSMSCFLRYQLICYHLNVVSSNVVTPPMLGKCCR